MCRKGRVSEEDQETSQERSAESVTGHSVKQNSEEVQAKKSYARASKTEEMEMREEHAMNLKGMIHGKILKV